MELGSEKIHNILQGESRYLFRVLVNMNRLDLMLLWLWYRLAAVAPVRPLAWKLPYATGVAKKEKEKKKQKTK